MCEFLCTILHLFPFARSAPRSTTERLLYMYFECAFERMCIITLLAGLSMAFVTANCYTDIVLQCVYLHSAICPNNRMQSQAQPNKKTNPDASQKQQSNVISVFEQFDCVAAVASTFDGVNHWEASSSLPSSGFVVLC